MIRLVILLVFFLTAIAENCRGEDDPVRLLPEDALLRMGGSGFRHGDFINCVSFSKDGKFIVSGSEDRTLRLWEVATGKENRRLEHRNKVEAGVFLSEDQGLASADGQVIHLWNPTSGRKTGELAGHTGQISFLAAIPNSRFLASGGKDKTIRIWDVGETRQVHCLRGHEGVITCLASSPNGSYLAS